MDFCRLATFPGRQLSPEKSLTPVLVFLVGVSSSLSGRAVSDGSSPCGRAAGIGCDSSPCALTVGDGSSPCRRAADIGSLTKGKDTFPAIKNFP
ncbi:hypothetical protein Tco_0702503 [Tanacetum coccineum]|uniref:Secreted protein n=1 Tax=Tanacetum coccineum TaxID=301880 RepID=A0ABQ4XWZ3_9ASTR